MTLILFCVVCGADRTHALVEQGTRYACNGCGSRSWPSADEAERAAVERTGPIEPSAAPSPVLTEDT